MHADDTKCFSKMNCLADVNAFQQNIDKLMLWSSDWQPCLSALKCKEMHIGRRLTNWLLLMEF